MQMNFCPSFHPFELFVGRMVPYAPWLSCCRRYSYNDKGKIHFFGVAVIRISRRSTFVRDWYAVAVAVSPHHQLITLTFTDKIPNLKNNVGTFNM